MSAAAVPNHVAETFVQNTTMKSILRIDQNALDQIMATAYLLYQAGRDEQVDILCRGLIAADHTYWWSYSLHAAALRRMGRYAEALAQLDHGLAHEPGEPKLLEMRDELVAALAAQAADPTATTSTTRQPTTRVSSDARSAAGLTTRATATKASSLAVGG
jgi:hypothetical protein